MNLDNFDSLFKEQISSLDHAPVPGVGWTAESGWEKVSANLNKPRRKIIFWFSAAATIIILLGFYFLMYQPFNRTQNMQTEISIEDASPLYPYKVIDNHGVEYTVTEQFLISENLNIAETSNQSSISEPRKPDRSISPVSMATLKPMQINSPDERKIIQYQNELLVIMDDKPKAKTLNRTYVLNEPNMNRVNAPAKKKSFTFRLGFKSKATAHPPKGLLAGL
nr:hypothetical protein [Bacteroidota bacterium]